MDIVEDGGEGQTILLLARLDGQFHNHLLERVHVPQFPFVGIHRGPKGSAQLLTEQVDRHGSSLLRATTLVGDLDIVLDFLVGLTGGAGEDFGGWLEGGEEAEAARVGFLLFLLLFGCGALFLLLLLLLFGRWVSNGR